VIKHPSMAPAPRQAAWPHRIVVEKAVRHRHRIGARCSTQLLHRYSTRARYSASTTTLGKETVQNLAGCSAFANTLIEPLWNGNYIDHVQITVAENLGIEKRADYYDKAVPCGDMLQNHLMQLLTLVAMEPPPALEADALRDEKGQSAALHPPHLAPFRACPRLPRPVQGRRGGRLQVAATRKKRGLNTIP